MGGSRPLSLVRKKERMFDGTPPRERALVGGAIKSP